jgi:hypothetical protein
LKGDSGENGETGAEGPSGSTAYELWIAQGNTGTVADFVDNLKGEPGEQGPEGVPGDSSIVGSGLLSADLTASLWTDYDTNFSFGYIEHGDKFTAGTAIETIIRAMLSQSRPEQPADLDFSNMLYNGGSVGSAAKEIGTSITINGVSFTTTGNVTIGGVYTVDLDVNIGSSAAPLDIGDTSPQSFADQVLTRSTPGNGKIYLTSTAVNKLKYIQFKGYVYTGGFSTQYTNTMTAANAQTIIDTIKTHHKVFAASWYSGVSINGSTATATAGNYTYIIYPSAFGDITDIKDPLGNSLQIPTPSFTKIGNELPVSNFAGTSDFTYNVNVYISDEDQAFAATDILTVT